jgi:MFS family permease
MPGALAGNRNFRRFWWGQFASSAGDAFAFIAMPLLVLDLTGSVVQMGNVTALACAAHLAMSLVSGIVVDRVDRRSLLIATDLARTALYAAIPVGWWLGFQSLTLVFVVAALGSALGNLFIVAQIAAVANIVERDRLPAANSQLQASQALTYAFGPVIAGAACARFGAPAAIAVDAASFAVSALSVALVDFRRDAAPAVPRGKGLREVFTGIVFIAKQPILRSMTATQIFVALLACAGLNAAVVDLFVYRLRHDLAQTSTVAGLCLGVSALGALAGALLSPRIRRRFRAGACILGGTGAQALGLVTAGLLPGAAAVCLGAGCWAFGLTLRAVINVSLRQELTPDELLGRVMAATTTIIFTAATLGALLVTRGAALAGASHALAIAGGLLAIVVLASTATPVARAR